MDNYYLSNEFAQSVTIHHFEKWINVDFRHKLEQFIEIHLNIENEDETIEFMNLLGVFTIELLKEATSYILDLSIQQHSTTSFSLSQYTLRNCLIYSINKEIPYILRTLDENVSDWEIKQIYTVNLPSFAATLQMIFEREKRLPCILHTVDIEGKFKTTFKKYFG